MAKKGFAALVSGGNNDPLKVPKIHILSPQVVFELASLSNYLNVYFRFL